nr:MAG TPA: hypothetical protein [Caudoviricetes sp.]
MRRKSLIISLIISHLHLQINHPPCFWHRTGPAAFNILCQLTQLQLFSQHIASVLLFPPFGTVTMGYSPVLVTRLLAFPSNLGIYRNETMHPT